MSLTKKRQYPGPKNQQFLFRYQTLNAEKLRSLTIKAAIFSSLTKKAARIMFKTFKLERFSSLSNLGFKARALKSRQQDSGPPKLKQQNSGLQYLYT